MKKQTTAVYDFSRVIYKLGEGDSGTYQGGKRQSPQLAKGADSEGRCGWYRIVKVDYLNARQGIQSLSFEEFDRLKRPSKIKVRVSRTISPLESL